MNINSNLKQELLVTAKREFKNPFANIEGKKPEVKLPELVDKVTLTTVDSSSFDKYVEEMENGKQGVVDKFGKALESIFGDFVKGLSAATETEETKEVEETTAVTKEDTTKADASKTNDVKTGNAVADKYIAEYNTTLGHLKAKLDILLNERDELPLKVQEIGDTYKKERAEVRANGNDASEYEKVEDNYMKNMQELQEREKSIQRKIEKLQVYVEMINSNIEQLTEISAKIEDIEDAEIQNEIIQRFKDIQDDKALLTELSFNYDEEFDYVSKAAYQTGNIELVNTAKKFYDKRLEDLKQQKIKLISKEYDAQDFMNQYISSDKQSLTIPREDAIRRCELDYEMVNIQNDLIHGLRILQQQYDDKIAEANKIEPEWSNLDTENGTVSVADWSARNKAKEEANVWFETEYVKLQQEFDKKKKIIYEEYAKIDGRAKQTNNTESVNSTTTSNPTTTTTVSSGLNELEDEEDKENFEIKLNDDVKTNFFKKNPNLNLEKTKDKESKKDKNLKLEKEPKIDRNISRIIDNLGSSKPELEDVIDAFDNAGKRADFNSINKVAKQLDVHFGSSAIRKALKNA